MWGWKMQRSKMLKIIENEISPCNSTYKKHRQDAAERILSTIEKSGMLPPRIKGAYEVLGFNFYRENNYWESENETI